jgi:hypothetical protein
MTWTGIWSLAQSFAAAIVLRSLDLLNKEFEGAIIKYCTPDEQKRVRKLFDINDRAIIELIIWAKQIEKGNDPGQGQRDKPEQNNDTKSL